uniref:Uncharacterized protein n=1 Tax=Panagrolaimus sp. JU765 TaxID=591449 RepID=A0AC34PWD3_9BILA
MGSGASTITTTTTKVDRIRVDDNGDIWKIKKNGQEKLCRPTSSKSNFGIIGKHFRNSTSATSSNSKQENDRSKSPNSQLEKVEAKKKETETHINVLQHEICLLELRNTELADEVRWLREQLNANKKRHSISDTDTDVESVKTKAKLERQLYENLVGKLQNDLKQQQEKYHKKLQLEEEMREKMENVIKTHLGETYLFDIKNSCTNDTLPVIKSFDGAKPLCRNLLSSHGRLSTPTSDTVDFIETIKEENPSQSDDDLDRSRQSIAQILNFDDQDKAVNPRPSTADVANPSSFTKNEIGRGDSAPAIYKRSKSREKRLRMRKKRDKDHDSMESLDDEIEDILNSSLSSISIVSNKKHDTMSAKSRDSGYLGDSGHHDFGTMKMS